MSFFGFLLLAVLILAGAWFYQWLRRVEEEIRAELGTGDEPAEGSTTDAEDSATDGEEIGTARSANASGVDGDELVRAVLAAVAAEPGVKQTALYDRFSELPKKRLQELFRRLEKDGLLTREKERGTYRLYRRK
ncbi:hypothetical protein EDC39_101185 [Geothermobacter ehrlichii]|uniref:Uncharacterized protein n=1 Tax=Geothermobacter ehrlichii TaxID=213224 RepID=A0A5D3WND4_9BACT|nr:hypothetical protein [Geothermobacter ehrlichii]TYP00025.1 hypothetical protein EDC39_101185 [Geothermobacter ehrlichii]